MSNIIKLGGSGGGGSSVIVSKTITQNGTYNASADSADGYNPVVVNVSGGGGATLALYEGKIDLTTGNIISDSGYYYSDLFDAPNGQIMFDLGETSTSSYVGVEMCTNSGANFNFWSASSRYRVANHSTYYSQAPKFRLSFQKQYLSAVIVKNLVNGTAYSINATELTE